ncbi:MAG: carboxypeptidase-like regulatory domain-containing protein [Terracidiphilus sp.]|nr:carboxypeptidase-like regulatory domain-containing protein [Terracidiphilus sp.]MDR3798030.1 carboxypeptidase-like regulatory domain-containing protein [Terracidiphilus sp.]
MKCSTYFTGFAVLMALGTASFCGAATASVSGLVRDSSGVPQIGAEVELLGPDLSIVASAYTNGEGRFLISSLTPGRYVLKAMGPSFLPSQRENVRVHAATIVNLTLYTLYEVIQWLPAQPRSGGAQKDDWAWTLRSAANRPLLRWLEDGPLIVDTEGSGARPKLKARIMATGQAGTFGENGERFSTAVEDTPSSSRELMARVDFAPDSDGGMESMLGFHQDLGFAGSVQSVAAVSLAPEVVSGGNAGLEEATVRSSELMHFGEALEAEVGSNAVAGRLKGASPSTVTALLPYATVAWHDGDSTVRYRMATMVPDQLGSTSEAAVWLPALAERNGALTIAHGSHQEIGWERQTDASGVSVLLYADHIENPVLEAQGHFAPGKAPAAVLFDRMSNLMRAAGPAYGSHGVQASVERRLPGGSHVRFGYASGNALVMPALPQTMALSEVLAAARSRHAQTFAISLSGTLNGTRTQWRASYTWQPDDAVTAVAPFAQEMAEPYLSLHFRQPIRITRDGAEGLEALIDMRNLLAEGYQPYILSDGTLILFAQDQRSFRAGLAFTF